MFNLSVDNEKCTGCRACELACSYHHGKTFNPALASLRIHRMERDGKIEILLYNDLTDEERGIRFPCDKCTNEPEPVCIKYCAPSAIVAV